MNKIMVMARMNLKVLIRYRLFLFFLVAIPILSLLLLNLTRDEDYVVDGTQGSVSELLHADSKIAYLSITMHFTVKVYDGSGTELSDKVLDILSGMGMFKVYRIHVTFTDEDIHEMAKRDASDDRIGAIIYLKSGFDQAILSRNVYDALTVYKMSLDEREGLFESTLNQIITSLMAFVENGASTVDELLERMELVVAGMPQKKTAMDGYSTVDSLNKKQKEHKANMGSTIAALGLAFSFCGVFIAFTLIEEKNDKVLTRITLSGATTRDYICSKLFLTFLICILQTTTIGIAMPFMVKGEIGVSRMAFLIIVFLLGLILSVLSLCLGVVAGNVISAIFAVFIVWMTTTLLSGAFFSNVVVTGVRAQVSRISPQKWFLDGIEMVLLGNKAAFPMMIVTTCAYLIFILSVGAVALKHILASNS